MVDSTGVTIFFPCNVSDWRCSQGIVRENMLAAAKNLAFRRPLLWLLQSKKVHINAKQEKRTKNENMCNETIFYQ